MVLRIVGVDAPQVNGALPFQQNQIQIQDTTTQNFAEGDAAVNRSMEVLKQESSVVAETQQKTAAAKAQSGKGDALVDIFNTTGKLLDRWNQIQAGEQKARQEGAESDVAIQVQDALFSMRDTLQKEGYKSGLMNARRRVQELLASNPNLSPQARKEIALQAYRQLDDLDQEFFRNAHDEQKDIKRQEIAQAEATTRIKVSGIAARLTTNADSLTPTEMSESFNAIEQEAEAVADALKLNDYQRAYYKASILKYVADISETSGKVREEAVSRMNQTMEAQKAFAELEAAYQSGEIPFEDYEYGKQLLKQKYPRSGATPVTQLDAMENANKLLNLEMSIQEAQEKNFLKNHDAASLVEANVTAAAMELLKDESQVWKYEQMKTIDSQRVLARFKQLKEQIPKVQNGQKELANMSTRIATLQAELNTAQRYANATPEQLAKLKAAGISIPNPNDIGKKQTELQGLQQQYQVLNGTVSNTFNSLRNFGVEFNAQGQYQISASKLAELDRIKKLEADGVIVRPGFRGGGSDPGNNSSVAPQAMKIAQVGKQWNGKVYTTATEQCANFIRDVFKQAGVNIGVTKKPLDGLTTGSAMASSFFGEDIGRIVRNPKQFKPGDIVAFQNTYGNWGDGVITHAGIYVGNGQIVDQSTAGRPVTVRSLRTFDKNGKNNVLYAVRPYAFDGGGAPKRGLGLPPQQQTRTSPARAESTPPYGALLLPSGGYIWGGKVYRPNGGQTGNFREVGDTSKHINKARPMTGSKASNRVEDYMVGGKLKNDPTANYGYKPIADDPAFAKALAASADRIGIPAQWLADIMAFETGGSFNPGIRNTGAAGVAAGTPVGLIQFIPSTAESLGTSTDALARMTRAQQMRYVEEYFKRGIQEVGKFKRMDDVFAFIWGGGRLVRASDAERATPKWNDGDITYSQYLNRIGEHVGRKYAHGLDRGATSGATHTRYHSNCATCRHQQQTLGKVVPHKG